VNVYASATLRLMADDDRVSVRKLRANLAEFLERAHRGETVLITRSGRLDAQLGPVAEDSTDGDA
jgi:prevent-host-death family protein